MKIQVFLFIAALLLFTALVQDTVDAFAGPLPSGKREMLRKVCIL